MNTDTNFISFLELFLHYGNCCIRAASVSLFCIALQQQYSESWTRVNSERIPRPSLESAMEQKANEVCDAVMDINN